MPGSSRYTLPRHADPSMGMHLPRPTQDRPSSPDRSNLGKRDVVCTEAPGWQKPARGCQAVARHCPLCEPWNAKTKAPILLVSARYDAGTPPTATPRPAEQRLGNAVLLTRDGWGHPGYQIPSKCIHQARVRYFVNLVTPPRGTFGESDEVPFS